MVLKTQIEAWNSGNLGRFMETYWNSADLTFFSGGNTLSGWQATFSASRIGRSRDADFGVLRVAIVDGPANAIDDIKGVSVVSDQARAETAGGENRYRGNCIRPADLLERRSAEQDDQHEDRQTGDHHYADAQ